MSANRVQQKSYQLEDRLMEGYAVAYRAYLARRDLPGPAPTFADFVEIRKVQEKIEEQASENFPALMTRMSSRARARLLRALNDGQRTVFICLFESDSLLSI